ncbi:MAG: phage tail protein [Saprospiraceae bacterium]|nr:tail fiber protein [Bacteroidia bacterium]NNE15071.1 phage tail protein [Saprospiraceae bacterium]NNL93264.1 phage tail protein [Saprospiraceae bacterium]
MDPFLGQIVMFGGNFAPRGWALCDGQLLPISQYSALFSILGTTYGGDGRTTFALPELRGRAAMHAGNGPGLTSRPLGQRGGQQDHVLTVQEMANHTHTAVMHGENAAGTSPNPAGNMLGATPSAKIYAPLTAGNDKAMGAGSVIVGNTGNSMPHNNMQPYLVVNYIIALQGTFPSRS